MEKDQKFVNELFGLGGNATVYRPPPRDSSGSGGGGSGSNDEGNDDARSGETTYRTGND